jgi:hypothetical protein
VEETLCGEKEEEGRREETLVHVDEWRGQGWDVLYRPRWVNMIGESGIEIQRQRKAVSESLNRRIAIRYQSLET